MIGTELLRYQESQVYFSLDYEASDLNLAFALPFQVGYSLFTLKEDLESYCEYVRWPNYKISQDAANLTRFDRKRYEAEARDPNEILDRIDKYMYDDSVIKVIQNGYNYDNYIHNNFRRNLNRKVDYSFINRTIDPSVITKAIKKQWTIPKFGTPEFTAFMYKGCNYVEKGLKSNLAFVAKEMGIQYDMNVLHGAGADSDLTKQIFRKQIWMIEI